jgi:hypothetical protein
LHVEQIVCDWRHACAPLQQLAHFH